MARVLVTGGTGDLGSKLVQRFAARGDAVRVLSRRPRSAEATTEWAQGDMEAGTGLDEAVAGADIVMHAATAGGTRAKADVLGTRNLLEACKRAGTPHFFYISIVGIERIPLGYYKAKLECERLIEASGVPFSILRAVQFHNLIDRLFDLALRLRVAPLPKSFRFQPIDTGEVAERMVDYAAKGPSGRLPDLGGPEVRTLGDLAAAWLRARRKRALILPLPLFGKVATGFRNGYNCTPDHAEGKLTWEQWLEGKYSRQRMGSE